MKNRLQSYRKGLDGLKKTESVITPEGAIDEDEINKVREFLVESAEMGPLHQQLLEKRR